MMAEGIGAVLIFVLAGAFVLGIASLRVVKEYERGVMFRLGHLIDSRGPGLVIVIPIIEQMQKVISKLTMSSALVLLTVLANTVQVTRAGIMSTHQMLGHLSLTIVFSI